MSMVDKIKLYFGFGQEEQGSTYTPPPSLEERLGEAAADRGYAFDLIDKAQQALRDAAQNEHEVAEESLRRAERGRIFAREEAERILATGRASAARFEEQASCAQRNAVDDSNAVSILSSLMKDEDDECAV